MSEIEEFVRQCGKMFAKAYCRILTSDIPEEKRIISLEKLFKAKDEIEILIKQKIDDKYEVAGK